MNYMNNWGNCRTYLFYKDTPAIVLGPHCNKKYQSISSPIFSYIFRILCFWHSYYCSFDLKGE